MKVLINKPRNHWISPFTIIEFFSRDKIKYGTKWHSLLVKVLTPISKVLQKFLDIIHPRIQYVKVDYFDVWSFDYTLAMIVLPGLKQLQDSKIGSALVDDEDVPDYLKCPNCEGLHIEDDCRVHDKWDYVLSEMIFAFESKLEDDFRKNLDNSERITKGFLLFGKYFECLWD